MFSKRTTKKSMSIGAKTSPNSIKSYFKTTTDVNKSLEESSLKEENASFSEDKSSSENLTKAAKKSDKKINQIKEEQNNSTGKVIEQKKLPATNNKKITQIKEEQNDSNTKESDEKKLPAKRTFKRSKTIDEITVKTDIVNKENVEENPSKRRSTRSTRNTRSMHEDVVLGGPVTPEKRKPKEFFKYRGAIKYYTTSNEIAEASDILTKFVDKQPGDGMVPLSFDMEWPFSFQTGPGKSAVIQICAELKCCYVFHLTNLKKLPAALVALLRHPRVCLHGVNIKNDFRKLARDYPEVNADELIANCKDLGVWCNEVCETGGRWSLDRLAYFLLEKSVDKNKKVRMSKWHVIPLEEVQLMYAAIDVYVGQMMYLELEKRLKTKEINEAAFLEKNGEAAFKAIKALGESFLNEKSDLVAI